jgi:hypothetical protein
MPPIQLGLATGGGLSDRAFSDLYRAFNDVFERCEATLPHTAFPPVSIVVHVSGPVTNWGPPAVGRVVRHRKPVSLEIAIVISRSEWEDFSRESHREVLILRVGEALQAAAANLEKAGTVQGAHSLSKFWQLATAEFRLWPIPPDQLLGPPGACPKCGGRLRTRLARQCRLCGADWH